MLIPGPYICGWCGLRCAVLCCGGCSRPSLAAHRDVSDKLVSYLILSAVISPGSRFVDVGRVGVWSPVIGRANQRRTHAPARARDGLGSRRLNLDRPRPETVAHSGTGSKAGFFIRVFMYFTVREDRTRQDKTRQDVHALDEFHGDKRLFSITYCQRSELCFVPPISVCICLFLTV